MKEVLVKEGNRSRRRIEAICLGCGIKFLARKPYNNRPQQKFCTPVCRQKTQTEEGNTQVICAYCKEVFSKRASSLANSKSGLFFCSREHKDLAQRVGGIKEIMPSHYGNGSSTYRVTALKNLPNCCRSCGYDKVIEILVVHHKDRNRDNASLDNLEILCPTCHSEEHFNAKDGMWTPKGLVIQR